MLAINDLKKNNQSSEEQIQAAIKNIVDRGWYVLGPEVKAFENEFADYCGTEFCVSLANGTDALEFALRALDVEPHHEIITVANAGGYSSTAINMLHAKPVYVDVDPATMTMDPKMLEQRITDVTKAIIVTHLYGCLADIESIMVIAKKHQIPVIEDCAQSHGAAHANKKAGSFGILGCFSFYPTKNLGCLGDGGAITTNDSTLAAKLKQLRQYGWGEKYHIEQRGGRNSRLDEIQAAILRIKLPMLDHDNERRRTIAIRYNESFKHLPIKIPQPLNMSHVFHLYVIRVQQREMLSQALKKRNIATDIHYPIPDYQHPAWKHLYSGLHLSVTEDLCSEILTLPCFPGMSDQDVASVITAVTKASDN